MAFLGGVNTGAKFSELKDGITISNGDIEDGSSNVIYDNSNSHIPITVLQHDSVTLSAGNGISGLGSISLGSSKDISVDTSNFISADNNGISVNIGSNLKGDGNNNIVLDQSASLDFTSNISFASAIKVGDSVKEFFGENDDFSQFFDSSTDEFVFRDEINNIDIFRQPKGGPTNFLQGIDAGPITAPEDSFSQIINEPVTSTLASGSRVGYSFSLDNQNIIEIDGEANGSGGIQNTSITLNRDVSISPGNIINTVTTADGESFVEFTTDDLETFGFRQATQGATSDIELFGPSGTFFTLRNNTSDLQLDANLQFNGGIIKDVGSRDSASTGVIRIGNNSAIKFRNSANSGDIQGIKVNGNDNVFIGDDTNTNILVFNGTSRAQFSSSLSTVRFSGNVMTQVGGATDAVSGAIRMGNATDIRARNNADSNDIFYVGSDTNDNIFVGGASSNDLKLRSPNGNVVISNGALRLDTNIQDKSGTNRIAIGTNQTAIRDESGNDVLEANSSNTVDLRSQGSNNINIAPGGNIQFSSDLLANGGSTTIWDSSNNHIPTSTFQFTDIQVSGSNGLSGGTASLGGSLSVGISGNLSLDSDLETTDGEVIWDESNTYIPQGRLENTSVEYTSGNGISGAGSVSLGSSKSISVDPSSFISTGTNGVSVNIGSGLTGDGSDNIILDESTSFSFSSDISFGSAIKIDDEIKEFFGSNDDFSQFFDPSNDDLVIRDEINNVDLIRQPKRGPTQFIQGADIGSIESPEDSLTQIINASVTSALSSGDTVGYTFAVDNNAIFSTKADSNGSGGIQNSRVEIPTLDLTTVRSNGSGLQFNSLNGNGIAFDIQGNSLLKVETGNNISFSVANGGKTTVRRGNLSVSGGDITDGSNTIFDQSNSHIPLTILQNDSITITTGNGLKNGSSVQLGNSLQIDVEPVDFAGSFLSDDGSDNLAINIANGIESNGSDSIRVSASDIAGKALTEGSSPYVLDVVPTNFAGSFISGDGSGNLDVNIGEGIQGDGNGNLTLERILEKEFVVDGINQGDHAPRFIVGSDTDSGQTDIAFQVRGNTSGGSVDVSSTINSGDTKFSILGDGRTIIGKSNLGSNNIAVGGPNILDIYGTSTFRGDITVDGTSTLLYDSSNSYIPQSILQNSSVTVTTGTGLTNGGQISLGSSKTINIKVADFAGFGVKDDGANQIQLDESTSFAFTSDIAFDSAIDISDGVKEFFGSNNDFSQFYDNATDEWVLRDESTGVDIIRQPKGGPTNFLQGVDAGPIASPEDSFTEIINAPVTSALASGSRVGYSFGLDNQNIIEIDGEANGSGGIQNTSLSINKPLIMNGRIFLGDDDIRGSNKQNINFGNSGGIFMDRGDGSGNAINLLDADSGGPTIINLVSGTAFAIGSQGTTGSRFTVQSGGKVEIPNGNLSVGDGNLNINGGALSVTGGDISLDIGQSIKDNNGVKRIEFTSGITEFTKISGAGKSAGFVANSPLPGISQNANSVTTTQKLDFAIINSTSGGLFSAVRYKAASSSPGTFELTNAELSLNGNVVTSVGGTNAATVGGVRLANNVSIAFRDSADGANINALGVTDLDKVQLGSSAASNILSTVQHNFEAKINLNSNNIIDVGTLDVSTIVSNNSSSPININNNGFKFTDDIKNFFGSNEDISQFYDSASDELVIRDEINAIDLIRQPRQGPTKFLQGADIGSIEAPRDSFTQIVNAPGTSSSSSGDTIGYSFAVDNVTGLEIRGESDGSGGINNVKMSVNNISDINQGSIGFEISGTKRAQLDNNGDLDIEGELTEGATL